MLPLLLLIGQFDLPDDRTADMRQAVLQKFESPQLFAPGPAWTLMPNFVYAKDTGLVLPPPPWATDASYAEAFELARIAWYESQPDYARAIIVFTSFDEGGDNLFYVPLANDVSGLGETQAASIFDDTPSTVLDGYIWMGSLDRLEEAGEAYFREAFLHEVAHRWGSYVAVDHPGLDDDALRGRQSSHWSFFVDSQYSPMEGNHWIFSNLNISTELFDPPHFEFSSLDLYLMGVLQPEHVQPFNIVTGYGGVSPAWLEPTPSTSPAHRIGEVVTLFNPTLSRVTIEDIIRGSGERFPPAVDRQVIWPVGVVYLSNGFSTPTFSDFQRLDAHLQRLAVDFATATGGRMILDIRVRGAGSLPPGAVCSSVDVCDRTQSDACEAPALGESAVCTRTCNTAAQCGSGQCCAKGMCTPARFCTDDPPTKPGMDVERPKPDPVAPPSLGLETAEPSGCTAAAHESTAPPLAILLLGLLLSRNRRRH